MTRLKVVPVMCRILTAWIASLQLRRAYNENNQVVVL